MKYTKGKWKKATRKSDVVITSNDVPICAVNWNIEEYEANTVLLSNAPQMYETLLKISKYINTSAGQLAIKSIKELIK